jgi:hypothetical protein
VLTTLFFSADAILVPVLNEHFGYALAVGSASIWFGVALVAAMFLPLRRAAAARLLAQASATSRQGQSSRPLHC